MAPPAIGSAEARVLRARLAHAKSKGISYSAISREIPGAALTAIAGFAGGRVGISPGRAAKVGAAIDRLLRAPAPTGGQFAQQRLRFGNGTEAPAAFTPLDSTRPTPGRPMIEREQEPEFRERIKRMLIDEFRGEPFLMARAFHVAIETIQKIVQGKRFAIESKDKIERMISAARPQDSTVPEPIDAFRELIGSGKRVALPNTAAELIAKWEDEALAFVLRQAEQGR